MLSKRHAPLHLLLILIAAFVCGCTLYISEARDVLEKEAFTKAGISTSMFTSCYVEPTEKSILKEIGPQGSYTEKDIVLYGNGSVNYLSRHLKATNEFAYCQLNPKLNWNNDLLFNESLLSFNQLVEEHLL
tara:strand:+ start:104 stop:496 length:393 start_codon:yes stop_codon:yes gene_type:complete